MIGRDGDRKGRRCWNGRQLEGLEASSIGRVGRDGGRVDRKGVGSCWKMIRMQLLEVEDDPDAVARRGSGRCWKMVQT